MRLRVGLQCFQSQYSQLVSGNNVLDYATVRFFRARYTDCLTLSWLGELLARPQTIYKRSYIFCYRVESNFEIDNYIHIYLQTKCAISDSANVFTLFLPSNSDHVATYKLLHATDCIGLCTNRTIVNLRWLELDGKKDVWKHVSQIHLWRHWTELIQLLVTKSIQEPLMYPLMCLMTPFTLLGQSLDVLTVLILT